MKACVVALTESFWGSSAEIFNLGSTGIFTWGGGGGGGGGQALKWVMFSLFPCHRGG